MLRRRRYKSQGFWVKVRCRTRTKRAAPQSIAEAAAIAQNAGLEVYRFPTIFPGTDRIVVSVRPLTAEAIARLRIGVVEDWDGIVDVRGAGDTTNGAVPEDDSIRWGEFIVWGDKRLMRDLTK